jgi:hypothetical protein
MYGEIVRGQAEAAVGRLTLALGRRPSSTEFRPPPDSALARDAEEAAADQPDALVGHGYRTWAFGRALAAVDGLAGLADFDEELFYVAALLHDVGLVGAVAGEDFTLRSAAAAEPVVTRHAGLEAANAVCDAIAAHATPGVTLETDGPIACYVQAGATCDLGALRLDELSPAFVDRIVADHPRTGFAADIVGRISAEARAVPRGRFQLLRRTGFTLAVRLAPLPD